VKEKRHDSTPSESARQAGGQKRHGRGGGASDAGDKQRALTGRQRAKGEITIEGERRNDRANAKEETYACCDGVGPSTRTVDAVGSSLNS